MGQGRMNWLLFPLIPRTTQLVGFTLYDALVSFLLGEAENFFPFFWLLDASGVLNFDII